MSAVSPSTRLGLWDYVFRALVPVAVLEIGLAAYDLVAHPAAPLFSSGAPLLLRASAIFVAGPLAVVISTLILLRAPGNAVGGFLLLYALGFVGWQFSFGLVPPHWGSVAFLGFYLYWGAIGFPALACLLLVFPTGRVYPPWARRWVVAYAGLKAAGTLLELAAIPPGTPVGGQSLSANPLLVPALVPYQNSLASLVGGQGLAMVLWLLAGGVSRIVRYRTAPAQQRQQIKWLAWSFGVLAVAIVIWTGTHMGHYLDTGTASAFDILTYAALMILPVASVGVATLRHRLIDIDRLISRTLVYGVLTAAVLAIYALVVGLLSQLSQTSGSFWVSLVATGLVAVLFQPLRARVQRGVNRLVYGERDDPHAVLARLGQRLQAAIAPDAVLPAVVETLGQALKVPYVALTLREGDAYVLAAEYARSERGIGPAAERAVWPLVHQSEAIGQLIVAPRAPGEAFTADERRLLQNVAHQAGVAVHAVRLTADLQRSRERLVTAREEERRRLRRDLHDGLGPALASLTLKLDAARNVLGREPEKADALLVELKFQVQAAIADIRRLVYDLRPPALDELGLVPAIRQYVARQPLPAGPHIVVEAPEGLPPLPAAIEVAAYRITLEAITNVVRHARAQQCVVRVTTNGALGLEITDDGEGLPAGRPRGVGMVSMQERAAELGGTCVIEPAPGGGTRVCAQLPLGAAQAQGRLAAHGD